MHTCFADKTLPLPLCWHSPQFLYILYFLYLQCNKKTNYIYLVIK